MSSGPPKYRTLVAGVLFSVTFIGQALVWFQGDQFSNKKASLWFFGLLVSTGLLCLSMVFPGSASGLLRATGTFFLLANIETALCLLPPNSTDASSAVKKEFETLNTDNFNRQRFRTMYVGGVSVIAGTLLSLIGAYTRGFGLPKEGVVKRIASPRGAVFLLSAVLLIAASALQWSWTELCHPRKRPTAAYPITNAILVIIAFIIVMAVVYGQNEAATISVFLCTAVLLMMNFADPVFAGNVDTWFGQIHFRRRWMAAKLMTFIGAVLLVIVVIATSQRTERTFAALPFDAVPFVLAIAGSVSVFTMFYTDGATNRLSYHLDYPVAYAIVITVLNMLPGVAGLESCQYIATFFAAVALYDMDNGSLAATTGYLRGGLQLCQIAMLLSVFLKAFPVPLGKPLTFYFTTKNKIAIVFGLVWLELAMLRVPNNYSVCALLAMITYKSLSSKDNNWGRTTFYILSFFGIVRSFPLSAADKQWFQVGNTFNDYVNSTAFFISLFYLVFFTETDAPVASAFALHTSEDVEVVTVKASEDTKDDDDDDDDVPLALEQKPMKGPVKYNLDSVKGGKKAKASEKDQFGNPVGDDFDLVRDGQMKGYKILVGDFFGSTGKHNEIEQGFSGEGVLRRELEKKGFTVVYAKNLVEFNRQLDPAEFHEAWVICSNGRKGDTPAEVEFMAKIRTFHLNGRGLFLCGDNDPWNAEVNDALRGLKAGFEVEGNTPGNGGVMRRLSRKLTTLTQGTFSAHPVTAGCMAMYDGNTICYPDKNFDAVVKAGRYEVIGISKQWNTICMVGSTDAAAEKGFGRVIIDCAFTKFFPENFTSTPGTVRYMTNVAAILTSAAEVEEFGPSDAETGKCPLRAVNPTEADLDAFVAAK